MAECIAVALTGPSWRLPMHLLLHRQQLLPAASALRLIHSRLQELNKVRKVFVAERVKEFLCLLTLAIWHKEIPQVQTYG